jgi:hypothetical protein
MIFQSAITQEHASAHSTCQDELACERVKQTHDEGGLLEEEEQTFRKLWEEVHVDGLPGTWRCSMIHC